MTQHNTTRSPCALVQEDRISQKTSRFHATLRSNTLRSKKIQEVAKFLDQQRYKTTRTHPHYCDFAAELFKKFEGLVSHGLRQFNFADIRQFLTMTEEEYDNGTTCRKSIGKHIRHFVVLVAGECCDCGCPVRGVPVEAYGSFDINHGKRGLDNYIAPSDDASRNGCVALIDHIVDDYNGYVLCDCCHKRDEDAHEQRGQDLPQAGVSLLCQQLRARSRHLSPAVSAMTI